MSSDERRCTQDAIGQFLRIGDLAAGVKLGKHPVTVAGQVTDFGSRLIKLRVVLVTDTGDHTQRISQYISRPKVGDVVGVWRERVFKVDAIFIEEAELSEPKTTA